MLKQLLNIIRNAQQREDEAISRLVEEEIRLRQQGRRRQGESREEQALIQAWERDKETLDFVSSSLSAVNQITQDMVKQLF